MAKVYICFTSSSCGGYTECPEFVSKVVATEELAWSWLKDFGEITITEENPHRQNVGSELERAHARYKEDYTDYYGTVEIHELEESQ